MLILYCVVAETINFERRRHFTRGILLPASSLPFTGPAGRDDAQQKT
ncbi:hypothetical protein QWZ16_21850 [Vibrio ostreicida]|uniref:Uncharacterized protein n=1 Tax=Vibrio ostreicida TaxID=526588 RepID=A0ABT8BYK8_9VIBR|nr:hypothetical protein [Vibrio ostreicida]MDN3612242.1 hypothetical protein [Vibrio ostreicida]